jgi:tungstate transport system ATP-binding protein
MPWRSCSGTPPCGGTASRVVANGVASLLPLTLTDVTYEAGGKRLVDRVNLRIERGPRTIVVGPNGAGKSVLLRICHGLLPPTSGDVQFNGPETIDGRRRHAMVFQRPVLLRRSALANVAYGLMLAGIPRRERVRLAEEALDRVGLRHLGSQAARVLSGGEQQRLAIARAWALQPELLLLDEPTANLDPSATQAIESSIQSMHEAGTKIVLITHNLGQAHRLGDEVVFLAGGRVLERTPVEQFLRSPASADAAAFIKGEMPW